MPRVEGVKEYLTSIEAADYLRVSEGTMRRWRTRREGPTYVKLGRCVVYRWADLDAYADRCRQVPEHQ